MGGECLILRRLPRWSFLVVNGNDFDVFAPGYIDSFVTNVMVTANGDWELVEPTALPLRMKGADTATYKVICPPECKDGGTIMQRRWNDRLS